MPEIEMKKKDSIAITFMDTLMILAPLLFFIFILAINGNILDILNKTEWSFVTVFYLIEVVRDQIARNKHNQYNLQQVESGIIFYVLILVFGIMILMADSQHLYGSISMDENWFFIMKFMAFFLSLFLFTYHRYRKHKEAD